MAFADKRNKLNTGAEIPALGLGTWKSSEEETTNAVYHAIKVGYRHIDTAFAYQNEQAVGKAIADAIKDALVKREELFITTKLWATYATRVEENLDMSLKNLGLDYVDLYLVHWPVRMNEKGNHPFVPTLPDGSRDIIRSHSHLTTWKEMEKLPATGKVKAIGVSNYSVKYLEELLAVASVIPAANQIENHPSLPQQEIVDYCIQKGIIVESYSPLGSTGSPLLTAEPIVEIAKDKSVSPASILLSYHFARGSVVLAKSVNPGRITANRLLVELGEKDLASIEKYSDELKSKGELNRYVAPPFGVDMGFPDKW